MSFPTAQIPPYFGLLDDYELNGRIFQTTGSTILDSDLSHMIKQTDRIKDACRAGFTELENTQLGLERLGIKVDMSLRGIQGAITGEIDSVKTILDGEIQNIKDSVYSEIKCDYLMGSTIGSKLQTLFDRMERMNMDIQNQMVIMDANIKEVNRKVESGGGTNFGDSGNHRKDRKLPILEYKSISNIDKLGSEKGDYRGWSSRVKNALRGIFGREYAWKFWMEKAEEYNMDAKVIRDKGYAKDQTMDAHYD